MCPLYIGMFGLRIFLFLAELLMVKQVYPILSHQRGYVCLKSITKESLHYFAKHFVGFEIHLNKLLNHVKLLRIELKMKEIWLCELSFKKRTVERCQS